MVWPQGLSQHQRHGVAARIKSTKNPNYPIKNNTDFKFVLNIRIYGVGIILAYFALAVLSATPEHSKAQIQLQPGQFKHKLI
jgi:hypothetical protein